MSLKTNKFKLTKLGYYRLSEEKVGFVSYPSEGSDASLKIENESQWFDSRSMIIESLVERHFAGSVFVDVGAGNGYQNKRLQQSIFATNGINSFMCEPSENGCENAVNRGVENVFCGLLDDFPLDDFDAVSIGLFDVVEHIEHDRAFIKGLVDRLSKGSRIFITVPALKFLWSNDDELGGHFRRFNRKEVNRLFEGLPVRLVDQSYFFTYYTPFVYLFRVLLGSKQAQYEQNVAKEEKYHKGSKFLSYLFKLFDFVERLFIKNGVGLPFGTSLYVIVEKK